MDKSARKSAIKWDAVSERALLEIWSNKKKELRSCRRNCHILLKMVKELEAQGHKFTVLELKTKMHNMSARYRKEKMKVRTRGSSPDWDLFTDVQALLSPQNSCHSEQLVVDSINDINSNNSSMHDSSPLPSPPMRVPSPLPSPSLPADPLSMTALNGLETFFTNLEKSLNKIQENIKHTSEKLIEIEEEKKDLLKSYIEREIEVQKALIEFLKRES